MARRGRRRRGTKPSRRSHLPNVQKNVTPLVSPGEENIAVIVGPDEKAAATMGRVPGKITLKQYETLLRMGLDGDIVRKWTRYHAEKEIQRRRGF